MATICPALSAMRGSMIKCKGNDCAWFVSNMNVCAVTAIANNNTSSTIISDMSYWSGNGGSHSVKNNV